MAPARSIDTKAESRPDSAAGKLRRIIVTASGFLLFAVVALLLSLLVFPPLLLLPVSWRRKRSYSRWILSRCLRLYLGYFRLSGIILQPKILGLENLQRSGQLIVASHPSLIDVLFLLALVEHSNCIAKNALWRNPVTIALVYALGYIRNDSPDLISQCAESLRQGDSLIIFPEGTRSRPGQALKFLRGAANIALAAQQDITPVIISCKPSMLRKDQKWYQVPDRAPQYVVEVCPSIAITPYIGGDQPRAKAARRLTADMEQFFAARYSVASA